MTAILASGLLQDPAVFAIRVAVAALLVLGGCGLTVMGSLAVLEESRTAEEGWLQMLWPWPFFLGGLLVGALGCLIGFAAQAQRWLGAWGPPVVFAGFTFGFCVLALLLWTSGAALASFRRSVRESRRRDACIFSEPPEP
jgi:hypothetical protein